MSDKPLDLIGLVERMWIEIGNIQYHLDEALREFSQGTRPLAEGQEALREMDVDVENDLLDILKGVDHAADTTAWAMQSWKKAVAIAARRARQ